MTKPALVLHMTQGPTIEGAVTTMARNNTMSHRIGNPATGTARQLLSWDKHARSLRNKRGGVETNNRAVPVYQYEIVGYSERVTEYPDSWYEWLAHDLRVNVCKPLGIPIVFPVPFIAYNEHPPSSYGVNNGVRMSFEEWEVFAGICGHMHVPENCVHPETPILKADLTWVHAGDLVVGDELVGFDAEGTTVGSVQGGRRYKMSTVTRNDPGTKDCFFVRTPEVSTVASADHPWLVRVQYVKRGPRLAWVRTKDLDPERHRIVSLGTPWRFENTRDAGWMAGVLDADGHAFAGGRHGSWVGFGQVPGLVLDRFLAECDKRGYRLKVIERGPGSSGFASDSPFTDVRILGGMWESCRVLGQLRPVRLFDRAAQMWNGSAVGKTTGDVAVLSIEHLGSQPIASLSTSTETYVANGMLCHNTHGDPGDISRLVLWMTGEPPVPDQSDPLIGYDWDSHDWGDRNPAQRAAQRLLAAAGFNPGNLDGRFGLRGLEAVETALETLTEVVESKDEALADVARLADELATAKVALAEALKDTPEDALLAEAREHVAALRNILEADGS